MTLVAGPGELRVVAPDPRAPAVELVRVRKEFGSVRAVRGIDLVVPRGQVVALLGPNGAGKTTTIDLVLGLSAPTSGRVLVCGMAPSKAVASGRLAAVLQGGGLLKDLTVQETVRYAASLYQRTGDVPAAMERAGIGHLAQRLVGRCSGGEQQRLKFAMALLPDPDLLVLDEPTTGLDVEGRQRFWAAVRHEADRGRTVLFATHYLEEADAFADRVVVVRRGAVVADGTPSQIRSLAAGRVVRATVATLDEEALRAVPGVERIEVRRGTVEVHARDSDAVARHLLTRTDARDVEIAAAGLHDAFLELISGDVAPIDEGAS